MLENIKKIDKKMLRMLAVVVAIIVLLIIAVVLMSLSTGGGTSSYSSIEDKLVSAGKSYFKDNDSELPTEVGDSSSVTSTTLASAGYIKDLSEYVDEDVICSAEVYAYKTYSDYDYVASLDCGDDYKTEFLYEKIIGDGTVSSGDGLYDMVEVTGGASNLGTDSDGYDLSSNELLSGYIYRGENVDNYISIDNVTYRIVKIDGNNDFTIISSDTKTKSVYDDRYNSEVEQNYGINQYNISRAYEKLTTIYEELDESSTIITKGTVKNVCVGSRLSDDTDNSGSLECSEVMKDQTYSLIAAYDLMNASLSDGCLKTTSSECSNYNYLMTSGTNSFWSMTPSSDDTYSAYAYITNGLSVSKVSKSKTLRYVYYLSNRLIYVSGTGTADDPYIVK